MFFICYHLTFLTAQIDNNSYIFERFLFISNNTNRIEELQLSKKGDNSRGEKCMCEHVCDESITTVLEGDRESVCGRKKMIIWCMLTIDCMTVNSLTLF